MGISAVICTKNEDKNIGRCLRSISSVVDEIIIVDSKSTDSTEQVCKSFSNIKFYESEWLGFSLTKNYGNSLATHDYILSLDADEELSLECQHEIKAIKSSLDGVYEINRRTNYCGKWINHSGWFPDRHIRLFPKKMSYWSGEIHEKLIYTSDLKIKKINGVVNHYSYYSIEEHWDKINRYTTLSANKYIKYNRARLLLLMGFNTKFRFLRHYIFKLGFLDGFPGLIIAVLSATAVFLKYAKAYQLKKNHTKG